MKHEHLVK